MGRKRKRKPGRKKRRKRFSRVGYHLRKTESKLKRRACKSHCPSGKRKVVMCRKYGKTAKSARNIRKRIERLNKLVSTMRPIKRRRRRRRK